MPKPDPAHSSMILLITFALLTACVPVNKLNRVEEIKSYLPTDFATTAKQVMIIPIIYHHYVLHVTDSTEHRLGSPIYRDRLQIDGLAEHLDTHVVGYFALTGTVHATEEHINYLILISDEGDALVLKNRNTLGWQQDARWSIKPSQLDELLNAIANDDSLQIHEAVESSSTVSKVEIDWTQNERRIATRFIEHIQKSPGFQ